MIDLTKLTILLDAAYYCKSRGCDACRALYKTENNEKTCPMWRNKENTLEALKAVEKYLDDAWDSEEYEKLNEVSEAEFMKILLMN